MEEVQTIKVEGIFDLAHCGEILGALQEALAAHRSVRLDLSAATGIDLAGLQLICSAHRTAVAVGSGFTLSSPLPPLLTARAREAGFPRQAVCVGDLKCACLWSGGLSSSPEEDET
ncbi:MAG TPA: STAS domain-containing protein [Geobacteraceae bacterium]